MKLTLFLLCFLFLLYPDSARSQPEKASFKHLSLEQGLSQSSVFAILQDRQGFMWIGTEDGLNRYDGYTFTTYRHELGNPRSLSSSLVYALYEDRQGVLWVGTEGGGLNRYDQATNTFTHYLHQPDEPNSLSGNSVYAIYEDRDGLLWVGTYGDGLNRFDRKTGRFTRYQHQPDNPRSLGSNHVQYIYQDRNGVLWIATEGGGLNRFEPATNTFLRYQHQPDNPASLAHDAVHSILEDKDKAGNLWLSTEGGGLDYFDQATHTFTHYRHRPDDPTSLSHDNISALFEDRAGVLWVGTYNGGLNRFDRATHTFTHYRHQPDDPNSLSNDLISSVYEDRSGVLWVTTFGGGVNTLNQAAKQFAHYYHQPDNPASLSHNTVYSMVEDQQGYLWVATEGGGLNRLDRKTNAFKHYRRRAGDQTSLSNDFVIALCEDQRGTLWVGTDGGLNAFDQATQKFTYYQHHPDDRTSLSSNYVQSIYQDRQGVLWVGTEGGLNRFERDTRTFRRYLNEPDNPQSLSNNAIYVLFEDRNGELWVGTDGGGLNRLDRQRRTFLRYQNHPQDRHSLSNNYVISLCEDRQGTLWVGTMGGLNRFDRRTGRFTHYGEKEGLPNEVVSGILEDKQGNLWLSTNKGLSKFNPYQNTFRNYDSRDGLQSNEFNAWAYHKSKRGEMFFGGINGFNAFFPEAIKDNPYLPPVVITDFQLFNQSVPIGVAGDSLYGRTILEKPITQTDHLQLAYDENVFSFEFAALNYRLSEKNRYAYRLEGFEEDWVQAGTRRFVTYTNLDPGEYTFHVKASNNDGVWNQQGTSVRITVTPPWWRTWWAYLLYGLLILAALYGLRHYTIARERLRNDLRLERLESEKLQELDQLKTRFFTNISHEFRTPLTLILGPLEQRLSRVVDSHPDRKDDQLIYRNAQRLLQLINQLLDISKLESGTAKLEVSQGDVVQFLRAIVFSFSSLADSRRIALRFDSAEESLTAYFDRDKLEKIISNLLSNAFKFTPEAGEISVQMTSAAGTAPEKPQWVEVWVTDSGIGIPADRLPRIFDRFYQVDGSHTREQEGTGIGLALTKELVQLHGGEITVESQVGKGTRFTVRLPLRQAHPAPEEIAPVAEVASAISVDLRRPLLADEATVTPAPVGEEHLPLILIVEDNPDVRHYIRDTFGTGYRVMEANDGEAGLERAIEVVPDLVISDLMMPRMDGIELCRRLKTDERTSHVPVILLTARASAKLEGLETGADDYLTKPFSPQELLVRVRNLIQQRQKLRERFSRELKLEPRNIAITSADEKFLQRAMETVEKHLSDPDFSIEAFESEMSMSKMQLYRKLKALTDQSPNEFIRRVRLKRAAQLLAQRAGNVAEITYEVGFNNLSYFAKCFKELYGVSPSEYANQPQQVDE